MRFGVARIRRDGGFELLLRVGNLAGVPENHALVEHRVGVAAARGAGGRAARFHRLLARGSGLVELPLRVVDIREPVVRLGVIGFQLGRLLVRLFSLVVVLLLRVREADVVVAIEALFVDRRRRLELRNRIVVIAGAARGDAFLEHFLQLGGLGRDFFRRTAGAHDEARFGGRGDADVQVRGVRRLLVFLGGHGILARRQADLHELAFLVRFRIEVPVGATGHVDVDLGAVNRLTLCIEHNAAHHSGRLGGRRHDDSQRERRARHQPERPAVHSADHGLLLNQMRATLACRLVYHS